MESIDRLFTSLIITFLGFIIFIFGILSKKVSFLGFVSTYFVLVLLSGMITTALGLIFILIWHVENARPYYEAKTRDFSNYLAFGVVLLLFSVFIVSFFKLGRIVYLSTLTISALGIMLLVIGLRYYIKDAFRRTPARS
jgi:hypothetical protein